MRKRFISTLLVLCMVLTLLPLNALALDSDFTIDDNGVLEKYTGPGGDIIIPNNVTAIDETAFGNCSGIDSVTIPKSVTRIGWIDGWDKDGGSNVFFNDFCRSETLIRIDVDSENKNYSSVDGVLFNKDRSGLYTYPSGKQGASYSIPNGVAYIGMYAFGGCKNLNSLTIPNSVSLIDWSAFQETNLEDIYYTGSREQWYAIDVDTWGNPIYDDIHGEGKLSVLGLGTVNIHYNAIPDVYDVVYLKNGGQGTYPAECWPVGATVTIDATEPTRDGYIFDGWHSNGDVIYQAGETFVMPASKVLLVATWIKISTLTYDWGGIGPYPATSHQAGETIVIPSDIPVKDDYIFKGWSDGNTTYQPGDTFAMPEHNVTMTAIWEELVGPPIPSFTVQYNTNGGFANIPTETYQLNKKVTVSQTVPTREGYIFDGWFDGSTVYKSGDSFTMPNHDVTLTAKWSVAPSVSPEMQYVQYVTQYSLAKADTESRKSIQNAIYNLLFKAQFRPISGPKINGIPATFTGSSSEIAKWKPQNADTYGSTILIKDDVLGEKTIEGSAGCMSYALFAQNYIYGTNGDRKDFTASDGSLRCESDVRNFIHSYAVPGAQIRFWRNDGTAHSIVFLGEGHEENHEGFYYISYAGGRTKGQSEETAKANHLITVKYISYLDFVKNRPKTLLGIRQTGFDGTFKSLRIKEIIAMLHCPIEATISLEENVLDSRMPAIRTEFGTVERIGESIKFILDYNKDYKLEILGTGTGTMNLSVEYWDEDDNLISTRNFEDIPVKENTKITSSGFDGLGAFVLYQNPGKDNEKIWGAGINETVREPDERYSSRFNGPDDEFFSEIIPNTPSVPVVPSYGGESSDNDPTYNINVPTRVVGGTVKVTPTSASENQRVTITAKPNYGYTLDKLTVTDGKGNELDLTDQGDGKYTFRMPKGKVSINAVFHLTEKPWSNPFRDVASNAWYYNAVKFVSENGLMDGYGDGIFAPDAKLSRAMLAQILYNRAGRPNVTNISTFSDVSSGAWYANAVTWAATNGLVSGYSNGNFGPDDEITREQLATIIWRYSGSPTPLDRNLHFADVTEASDYALDALQWASENSIINGMGNNMLAPKDTATRAQVAQVLQTYLGK